MITTKFMKNLENNIDACFYILENKLEAIDDILYEDGVALFNYFRGKYFASIEVVGYKKCESPIDTELSDNHVCGMIMDICSETFKYTNEILHGHTITKEQRIIVYKHLITNELGEYLSSDMSPNKNELHWDDLD